MVVDHAAPASEPKNEEEPQPAAVVPHLDAMPKLWLLDTGNGHDLVGRDEITDSVAANACRAKSGLMLQTANGPISVAKQVNVNIAGLSGGARALILDSTPAGVSLGRRCTHEGFSFRWDAYGKPDFRDPAGRQVPIVVERDIPYAVADANHACPAEEAAPVAAEPAALADPPDDPAPEAAV